MKVLVDSDALFAIYFARDALHDKASFKLRELVGNKDELVVTNLVLQEIVTIISSRLGQSQALEFLIDTEKTDLRVIFVDEPMTEEIWNLFRRQTKKGTSFVDCANVMVCKSLKLDKIFSFDKFYKRVGLEMVQ